MKILLVSNAPWVKTGYGQQTASLARRLRDAGHKVVIYANYGLQGSDIQWEGIEVLPGGPEGGYNDPIIKGHIRYANPDLLITLHDLWPWANTDIPGFIQERGIRWAGWFPIDAMPISPSNLRVLGNVTYRLAMANFAEEAMREIDPNYKVMVIPHGVEKDFGYTASGRAEFRRHLQVPEGAFLFGAVGRNAYYPGRKGHDRLMRAFSELPEDIKANSYLYIHALTASENGSIPLPQVAEFYGISDRVKFADDYNGVMGYSQVGMNSMYSAMDCLVQATLGEGFGIPVLEAQACGAPVIATDCTSMPELVCPGASMLIKPVTEILTPDPAHRALIDTDNLRDAMVEIYEIKRDDPSGYRAMKGRVGLWANGWDWDRIWSECWVPFLEGVQKEVDNGPRKEHHRGNGIVTIREDDVLKQDSTVRSPAVAKELAFLRKVEHPNLIPVLDSGVNEDGTEWFTMPKLRPLRDVQVDSLTEEQSVRIIDGVRSALVYLHNQRLAHRDVCPENVVVDETYNPYLIDFEWSHPCDGTIGEDCVDFEPWACPERAVAVHQMGMEQRGFHTIVQYVRGIDLSQKEHGFKGVPYQAIDGVGERDCERRWNLMQPDVKGKSVIDIGCNLGWFVRKSLDEGAFSAWGLDFDASVLGAAKGLSAEYEHAYLYEQDFNEPPEDWSVTGHWDVGFCLSVLQHLNNPDRVFDWLLEHCDTLYIEQPPRFITEHMAQKLAYADYIGESERGRPLYRLVVRTAVAA